MYCSTYFSFKFLTYTVLISNQFYCKRAGQNKKKTLFLTDQIAFNNILAVFW